MASNKLGPEVASALRDRVADLRAAVTKSDLIVGNPTVGGTLGELLTIDLGHEASMTWTANHPSPRLSNDGSIDWVCVSRVRLLRIEKVSHAD